MDLKGKFIKVLDKEHGKRVVQWFKDQGIYTGPRSVGSVGYYYGVNYSGYFDHMSLGQFKSINGIEIFLPEEKSFPRIIQVKTSNWDAKWETRVCVKIVDNEAICWNMAETIEEAERVTCVTCWSHWRELDYVEPALELTIEEVAEKFGVKEVKIKQVK